MKKINTITKNVIFLILIIVFMVGCGGGENAASKSGLIADNTAPTINDILFNECIYEDVEGVYFRYMILYTDQEMDAINILVTFYKPNDHVNIYKGPVIIPIDYDLVFKTETLGEFTYAYESQCWSTACCDGYPNDTQQKLSIPGLFGQWRIGFQIEDSQGNESEIVSIYYEYG